MSTDDDDISGLYRQADSPAPSRKLDDAILAASRDAVRTPAAKGPFSGAWPAAASIAAVVVITVILVPIIKQEEPQPEKMQTGSGKASTAEMADEAVLNEDAATEMKKKMLDAPTAASLPALRLQQDDQVMPAPTSLSTRAAREAPMGNVLHLEKEEETVEPDALATQRSRMQAADSAPFAILTPEMWEVKISRLITAGKIDQAKAEIEQLEKHYPEHHINPSILENLNSNYE